MPAASNGVARGIQPGDTDRAYGSRSDLIKDVVKIIQAEVKALVDEGATYIQLDNPHYPDYIPESRLEEWRAIGIDPARAIEEDVAADAACFDGVDPARVPGATHICRGNGRRATAPAGVSG